MRRDDERYPLVSIVIPAYNREDLIEDTLLSIRRQTYLNWECLIIDDSSTDQTPQIVSQFVELDSRFKLFSRPPKRPKGANACRNYGFEQSQGEFIFWFDSDDLLHPEALEKMVPACLGQKACICSLAYFIDGGQTKEKVFPSKIIGFPVYAYLQGEIIMQTQNVFFKRTFLDGLDLLFDEHLQRAQEFEFYWRIRDRLTDIPVLADILVRIRKHENSIEGQTKTGKKTLVKDELKVYNKILNTPLNAFALGGSKIKKKIALKYFEIFNWRVSRIAQFSLMNKTTQILKQLNLSSPVFFKCYGCLLTMVFFGKGYIRLKSLLELNA